MAVGAELLGKQVRCPHCQQVIQAPATVPGPVPALAPAGAGTLAPAGAGAPTPGGVPEVVFRVPTPQRTEEEGSIFGETEEEGDDLFNSPRAPTVELPPAPAPQAPPAPAMVNTPAAVATTPMPALTPSHPANGAASVEAHGEGAAEFDSSARARQLARMQSQKESKLTFMLLIVIVPYALIMTIFVIFLVLTRPDPKSYKSFDKLLPDNGEGKSPIQKRADDARPLADDVKVALAPQAPLKINQLEITPLKIAWTKVFYLQENGRAEPAPSQANALVLTLRVKNTSETDTFAPNDLFFNRYYDSNSSNKPYTCVEILDKGTEERFYGGPTKWRPRTGNGGLWRQRDPREFIKGSEYNHVLQPGQEMEMIVCTDPGNTNVIPAVSAATNLLWRVQLRCGFITEGDRYGTVTTVIGVPFKSSEIANEG
jgi:hypothetical protein